MFGEATMPATIIQSLKVVSRVYKYVVSFARLVIIVSWSDCPSVMDAVEILRHKEHSENLAVSETTVFYPIKNDTGKIINRTIWN